MEHDILDVFLRVAFREPGCPVCRLVRHAESRYVFQVLYEYVNDGEERAVLAASHGFCRRHAWELVQLEMADWGTGMGTAILYEDFVGRVLATLRDHLPSLSASPQSRTERFHRAWAKFRRSLPAGRLAEKLRPLAPCRACQRGEMNAQYNLERLIRNLAEPEFVERYRESDGLCLPHLRQALAMADDRAASVLVAVAIEKLEALLPALGGYIRKHAWEFRAEPKLPEEQSSWIRAVAFMAGEVPDGLEESEGGNNGSQPGSKEQRDHRFARDGTDLSKPDPSGGAKRDGHPVSE